MVTLQGQTSARLRALARNYLEPELAAEVERLYALEATHQHAAGEIRDLKSQLHRSTVMAGELRDQVARAHARIDELCPPEIIKARHDAYMLGAGYFKVISLGRQRYAAEHIPAEKVSIRAD